MKSTTIALCNPRGGVGKTTISLNLATILGRLGQNVLLVDFDPDAHLTNFLGEKLPRNFKSLYHFMAGESDFDQITYKYEFFDYVPNEIRTANYNTNIAEFHNLLSLVGDMLQKLSKYNYILIDCPPSVCTINLLIINIADYIISPITLDAFTVRSIENLFHLFSHVDFKSHSQQKFLINRYIPCLDSDNFIKAIISYYGDILFNKMISDSYDLKDSLKMNKTIFEYNEHGNSAKEFINFGHELISTTGGMHADLENSKR